MNILAIGNSFSQDANRYFYGVAKAAGVNVFNANLYIGGCPLDLHYRNIMDDKAGYLLEIRGISTGFNVSIKEALLTREWDVVTIQQASPKSPFFHTYTPFVQELAKYIRTYSPKAKLYIHQTWAYEEGSPRIPAIGFESRAAMFEAVKSSYAKAAELISADGIIPSGEVAERATALGIEKIHRDGGHISLGVGRYAFALTWLEILTGKSAIGNTFRGFDVEVTDEEIDIAQRAAHEICELYR